MCKSQKKDQCLSRLGTPERIWVIPAIHGHLDRLCKLHDALFEHFTPGDKIVYLGNYTGHSADSAACVDEILTFRRMILSMPGGVICDDLTYLRGAQEEMWQKLLQLQFAPNPVDVLLWMLGNGLSETLNSYGLCVHDGVEACRFGVVGLTKWTHEIRRAVRRYPGHETLAAHYTRAAFTDRNSAYPMLFVHAGLDIQKPLEQQGDELWWAGREFEEIDRAYEPFQKVVRGYDPAHKGVKMNCVTATLDGGCGFGGPLVCAGFDQDGTVFDMLES